MEDQKKKKTKNTKYNNSVEYNKNYYEKKRTEILSSLKTKCECPDCGRIVSYARLNLHRKTDICLRNKKDDMTKMKEQIEKLTQLLKENEPL
jgi:hypothetical protein